MAMAKQPQTSGRTERSDRAVRRPAWPQWLALLVGLVYAVLTVTAIAMGDDATDRFGRQQIVPGLGVSWVLTVVHAGTGLWGLLAALRRSASKLFGVAIFMAYIGLSAYSVPAVITTTQFELLNVGWGNAALYLITTLAGLAISIGASGGKPFPTQPPRDTDEVM